MLQYAAILSFGLDQHTSINQIWTLYYLRLLFVLVAVRRPTSQTQSPSAVRSFWTASWRWLLCQVMGRCSTSYHRQEQSPVHIYWSFCRTLRRRMSSCLEDPDILIPGVANSDIHGMRWRHYFYHIIGLRRHIVGMCYVTNNGVCFGVIFVVLRAAVLSRHDRTRMYIAQCITDYYRFV